MKIVIGIILVVLLIGALTAYLILMLNAHQMIYCGDITNEEGTAASVTRVYTTDLSANEALSEIVAATNAAEGDTVSVVEITEILAEYQSIIYAPVFTVNAKQIDTSTFEVTGSVFNGIDDDGNPTHNDYIYKNMRLTAVVQNGEIIAAQNVYPAIDENEDADDTLVERNKTIDPIITEENIKAIYAFEQCDSFRLIFQGTAELPASMTFVFTYDVVAENPLDFTGIEDGALGFAMNVAYDEEGVFDPTYNLVKTITVEQDG